MRKYFGKIKVVRIIARLNIGGPAIQAITLTENLSTKQFTSFLVTGKIGEKEGDMLPYAKERNVYPIIFPELGREISSIKDVVVFFKLLKFLRATRPHIVHTHTAKAGTLGRLAAFVARVPIKIHTFHGHVFAGYFSWGKSKVFIIIERILAMLSDRLLVLSKRQYEELVDVYRIAPSHKFQIVPLGFDLESFLALKVEACGGKSEKNQIFPLIVGFVGRLVEIKNPFMVFNALSLIESQTFSKGKKKLHIQLWIAGRGPMEDSLREYSQNRNSVDVKYLGWQHDLPWLYSSLDIVILSSINEGTPVVLIEAMASAKPFIATAVGGIFDLMIGSGIQISGKNGGQFTLYENGILVPSRDVQGLAEAIEFLANEPEKRIAMGKAGREFVQSHFMKDRLIHDVQGLYKDLLMKKGFQRGSELVLE